MSHQQMKAIASEAPTTMDELAGCGLPENVQKTYGERLLKNVNAYIDSENLQSSLANRPKKKSKADSIPVAASAAGAAKPSVIDIDDSGDEFGDDGIDFSAIELPSSENPGTSITLDENKSISKLKSSKSSSYFK
jgi:hypothetical protein